ncbi:ABC transporter ATP-binding protein [Clostridium cibarium]|uniref:ABC transporter ATP-binding protein n=1 Tax=Clostridium cibarium TaxID=2762247 RepID=A0ABR8PYN0_9CLOT|nr:ABC transporter ATP-binding protein [Clostridium cibarium]MBD7913283.1 ABC transporter ATP-binding protein [Clostridium cibarium]
MLEIKYLTKTYKKFNAVNNLNLAINEGEIGVLAGPNGAGKSTTIKCIAGLLRYIGDIKIGGFSNKSIEGKKLFGYVPELPGLFPLLTVREHIHFVARAYGLEDYEEYANVLFDIFDLSDKTEKFGSELSKGMQQKLSICCALVTKPKLILFDEPMIGLDPKAIKELKNLMIKLKEQGVSMIVSTHLLDSVEDIWDRIVIMNKGTVVFSKTKSEFENTSSESLEDIFFKVTEEGDK